MSIQPSVTLYTIKIIRVGFPFHPKYIVFLGFHLFKSSYYHSSIQRSFYFLLFNNSSLSLIIFHQKFKCICKFSLLVLLKSFFFIFSWGLFFLSLSWKTVIKFFRLNIVLDSNNSSGFMEFYENFKISFLYSPLN
jgi:hypothetical protein